MDTWSTVDSQGHDNMEAGEGLSPLSSGFNSALLGYHIAKLLRGKLFWSRSLFHFHCHG